MMFALLVVVTAPISGVFTGPASGDDIDTIRERLLETVQRYEDAHGRMHDLELQVADLRRKQIEAEEQYAAVEDHLRELAIERYTNPQPVDMLGTGENLNDSLTAKVVLDSITQGQVDEGDDVLVRRDELEMIREDLTEAVIEQRAVIGELAAARVDLEADLLRLEELEAAEREAARLRAEEEERQRIEEERRRAEEEAAQLEEYLAAVEAAEAQAAAEAEAAAATTTTEAPPEPTPEVAAPADPTPDVVPGAQSGGGLVCPVQGAVTFIDSWGYPRSGGRSHKGVDMMANHGVTVVAPTSGMVEFGYNSLGGDNFKLSGDNGDYYYGAHLQAFVGTDRWVEAGEVIGEVGSSGNANAAAPHLHFEIHPNHGSATNPYPATAAACGL
jgi:septal ring factor EnvC (AmiA/AmiB activator)